MISKLYSFLFSVFLRGIILGLLALFMTLFFLGYTPINTDSFLFLFLSELGFSNNIVGGYMAPLILFLLFILVFTYSIKRERFVMGIISSAGRYSVLLSIIVIVCSLILLLYSFYFNNEITDYNKFIDYLLLSLFVGFISWLLISKYPLISVDLYVVSDSKERNCSFRKELELSGNDLIKLKIFGKPDFSIKVIPEGSMYVGNVVSGTYYYYVEITPTSSHTSILRIFYNDSLIGEYRVVSKNICLKDLTFIVYYNDDKIYEHFYRIECRKTLLDASKQVIKAALARLGLDITDVKDIQYYTEGNVLIPSDTLVGDLMVEKVLVKLYVVDKYLEVLKYYGRKDVLDLWDSLVRRLEILIRDLPEIEEFIARIFERIHSNILFTGDKIS